MGHPELAADVEALVRATGASCRPRCPLLGSNPAVDPGHPVSAARCWADPIGARLEVLRAGGVPWCERDRGWTLIAGRLNHHATPVATE